MHRVEEHARGLRLDGRNVGIRLPAKLCQRFAQRACVTDIDEIEAVIDRVHVGVELGVGTSVESARHGKRVAAAGARPIGQRRVADRLHIYVILDGDELRIGAAWLGADADQPLLLNAALSPRARSRNVGRVCGKIAEDRRRLSYDHARSHRDLNDGERVGKIGERKNVADLLGIQPSDRVRPGEEAADWARHAIGVSAHILRGDRGANDVGLGRRREARWRPDIQIAIGVGAGIDLRHEPAVTPEDRSANHLAGRQRQIALGESLLGKPLASRNRLASSRVPRLRVASMGTSPRTQLRGESLRRFTMPG